MEDTIWSILGNIAGGAISDTDAITDVVSEIVRNNNLDNADAGTYTFFYKNKIRAFGKMKVSQKSSKRLAPQMA